MSEAFDDGYLLLATVVGLIILLGSGGAWGWACGGALLTLALSAGQVHGWWSRLARWLGPRAWRVLRQLARLFVFARKHAEDAGTDRYDILLGYDPATGAPVVENLADLGHVGVYGTTRFGKTTWLHSVIHYLIQRHSPAELRLCLSDPKSVDYPFYGRLPHLAQPIATNQAETETLVAWLLAEMEYRASLFRAYAGRRVCNNLDRYAELSGQELARIVVIFDELADVVQPGSELEAHLVRLGKLGLAYGIHLILATQRPSSKVVTGEIKSQMASKLVTWMPTAREYGVVAELPREMYEQMPRTRGRFMAYTAAGWQFIQGRKIPDAELEHVAERLAGRPRRWPAPPAEMPAEWGGDDDEKSRLVRSLGRDLGRRPTINEACDRFNISRPTAIKYLKLVYEEGA